MNLQLPATQAGNSQKNSLVDFGTKQEFTQRDSVVNKDKPRFNETLDKTMQAKRQSAPDKAHSQNQHEPEPERAPSDDASSVRNDASPANGREQDKEKTTGKTSEHTQEGAASETAHAENADGSKTSSSSAGQPADNKPGETGDHEGEPAELTAEITTSNTADIPSPLLAGAISTTLGTSIVGESTALSAQSGTTPLAESFLTMSANVLTTTQTAQTALQSTQHPLTGLGLTHPLMQTIAAGTAKTVGTDKMVDIAQSESPLSALKKYFTKQRESVTSSTSINSPADTMDAAEGDLLSQSLKTESQAKSSVENALQNGKTLSPTGLLQNGMQTQNTMLNLAKGEGFPSFNLDAGQAKSGDGAEAAKLTGTALNNLATSTSGFALNATGKPTFPVNITFGRPEWAGMVAERSAMMAAQSIKFAELQLDPPELGPLQVKVSVNQDQHASVTFVSANPQVREALDQSAARLREMLQEQGVDLLNVDISDHSSDTYQEENESGGAALTGENEPLDEKSATQTWWVNDSTGVDYYV